MVLLRLAGSVLSTSDPLRALLNLLPSSRLGKGFLGCEESEEPMLLLKVLRMNRMAVFGSYICHIFVSWSTFRMNGQPNIPETALVMQIKAAVLIFMMLSRKRVKKK